MVSFTMSKPSLAMITVGRAQGPQKLRVSEATYGLTGSMGSCYDGTGIDCRLLVVVYLSSIIRVPSIGQ